MLRDSRGRDAFEVSFVSMDDNPDGTSSWTYHVRELPGGKDLSHWNLKLDPAHIVRPGTTAGRRAPRTPRTRAGCRSVASSC